MLSVLSMGRRASVSAKARTMKGRMLPDDFFWHLLFNCHSMSEIARQLSYSESYGDYLKHISSSDIHRYELEAILSMVPLYEAFRFRNYLGPRRWDLVEAWKLRYDVDILKRIFRLVLGNIQSRDSIWEKIRAIPDLSFPSEEILEARNFEDLLLALKDTPYFSVLSEPINTMIKTGSTLFPVEMALDGFVMNSFLTLLYRVGRTEKKQLLKLFGARADLMNIYWLYRSRVFFNLKPEEILTRLIPFNYRLNRRTISRLAFSSFPDEFMKILEQTPYLSIFQYPGEAGKGETELIIERNLKRFQWDECIRTFRMGVPGIHTVMAYLYLREMEVADLITIIEDVRYDLSRRMAVLFLVRPMKSEGGI